MTHISMHMIVRQDLEIARLRKDLAVAREALQYIADWPDTSRVNGWATPVLPVAVLAVARGALDKTEGKR